VLYAWRIRQRGVRALHTDPFACLLFTFPFPVLWSLHDFQQFPDFFIFLPYVAVALGWLAHGATEALGRTLELTGRARRVWAAAPGLLLVLFSAYAMHYTHNEGLRKQWRWVREFESEYPDARVAVLGHPEALALLQRSNVTRYGFIMRGIARYIDENEPGGFRGWLNSIDATAPDVLIVDEDYPERLGAFADDWREWLAGYERRPEPIGDWSVFLPRAR
jgi:uncharacterized membrane protein YphA (DoxX/SURF4 family)